MRRYLRSAGPARLADEMVAVAVVLLALSRGGSTVLPGAVTAAYAVPPILSGPLLGAWLDRLPGVTPALWPPTSHFLGRRPPRGRRGR